MLSNSSVRSFRLSGTSSPAITSSKMRVSARLTSSTLSARTVGLSSASSRR